MFGSLISGLTNLAGPASQYIMPAVGGAGVGALGSLLSGGDPMKGALTGGVTGGAIGAFGGEGGALAQALGLSGPQVNALLGAAGGGLGYGLTGQNPLIGALLGGAGGYLYNGNTPGGDAAANAAGARTDPNVGGTAGVDAGYSAPAASDLVKSGMGGGPLGKESAALTSKLGGLDKTSLILGALAALGSTAKPKQGTWQLPGPAQNPNVGPTWNASLNRNVPGRTAVNPYADPTPSYWTYGGPEPTFFQGNTLRNFGFAGGGDVGALGRAAMADGGQEVSTANGTHYVEGPGDGQADRIPAALSDGEFIVDATTVSRLGNGSNRRGAERLEEFRRQVANDAGSKTVVQKRITKTPAEYFAGGRR